MQSRVWQTSAGLLQRAARKVLDSATQQWQRRSERGCETHPGLRTVSAGSVGQLVGRATFIQLFFSSLETSGHVVTTIF